MQKPPRKLDVVPDIVRLESLEARVLYSADLAPLLALVDPAEQLANDDTVLVNLSDYAGIAITEVVIVDSAHPEIDELEELLRSQLNNDGHIAIVTLDSAQQPVDAIAQILSAHENLNAVHIISHASEGALHIGDQSIDQADLLKQRNTIKQWGESLHKDGDILLYGCNLSASDAGREFAQTLSSLTDADIASSSDVTGHALRDGDWDLEVRDGTVEAEVVANAIVQSDWSASLDITTGLIHHWTLDGNASDSAGTADGIYHNNVGSPTGLINQAGDFSESNSSYKNVEVGAWQLDAFGTDDFSIAFWAHANTGNDGDYLIGNTQSGSSGFSLHLDAANRVVFSISSTDSTIVIVSQDVITDSDWRHIVATRTGNTIELSIYNKITGEIDKSSITVGGPVLSVGNVYPLRMGVESPITGAGDYDGMLDDVRIYDRVLSAEDAGELAGLVVNEQILVVNEGVTLDMTGYASVTPAQLNTVDNNNTPPSLIYTVKTPGVATSFELSGVPVGLNDSFTQADINNGLVTVSGANVADVIGFSVDDGQGAVTTADFSITPVSGPAANSAPDATDVDFSIPEDEVNSPGQTIQDLVGPAFIDADPGAALSGILIHAHASIASQGAWEYSTNGSDWYSVGVVDSSNALALSSTSLLRFVPTSNYNGVPVGMMFHVLDNTYDNPLLLNDFTDGATRVFDSTSPNGGLTAISASIGTMTVTVDAVNDSPTVSDVMMASFDEDELGVPGDTIYNLFAPSFFDDDVGDTLTAIAVVANTPTVAGDWAYSVDGMNWHSIGAVSADQALVLTPTTYIKFFSASDFNGSAPKLTAHAIDSTYTGLIPFGASRLYIDTTTFGVDGPLSITPADVSVTVLPTDDPPTLNAQQTNVFVSELGGAGTYLTGISASDPDAGDTVSLVVLENGLVSANVGVTSTKDGLELLQPLDFETQSLHNIVLEVTDSSGLKTELPIGITVLNANEWPSISTAQLPNVEEDNANPSGQSVALLFDSTFTDADGAEQLSAVAISNNPITSAGVWQYSLDGAVWVDVGVVSDANALVVSRDDFLRFKPSTDFNGMPPALEMHALDDNFIGSTTSTLGPAYLSTATPTQFGSISQNAAQLQVTVNPINDPPIDITITQALQINENANSGDSVGIATGVDPDDAVLSYALASDAGGRFTIDSVTGAVSVLSGSQLNYENDTFHQITIEVTDSQLQTYAEPFLVTITDVNEAPGFTSIVTLSDVVQGADNPSGEQVVDLFSSVFTDPDVNQSLGGIAVVVNNSNPALGVWQYEIAGTWYDVGLVSESFALVLNPSTSIRFLPSDDHVGAAPSLLVHAIDNTYFDAGNPQVAHYSATVVNASNNAASAAGTVVGVTITQNSSPTDISSSAVLQINENASTGDAIGFLVGVDDDSALNYSMTDSADGRFQINSTTGQVTVLDGSKLDFEAQSQHSIAVQVTDPYFQTVSRAFTVYVHDVNEAPALLSSASLGNIAINDSNPPGRTVSDLFKSTFSDPDSGQFFGGIAVVDDGSSATEGVWQYFDGSSWQDIGQVTYSNALVLDQNQSLRFLPTLGYSGTVGVLTIHALDNTYNSGGNLPAVHYSANIIADAASAMSVDTQTINVSVSPNATPHSLTGHAPLSVDENALDGTVIGTLVGSDVDDVQLTYALSSNAGGRFDVDPNTGEVFVLSNTNLDYETNTFHQITVNVSDPLLQTFSKSFLVAVNDVNEAPRFTNDVTMLNVFEDDATSQGQRVVDVFDAVFMDPESGPLAGVEIVQNDSNIVSGQWQYSRNGSWVDVGTVSAGQPLNLNATDMIRFLSAVNYVGPTEALHVHAIDSFGFISDDAIALTAQVQATNDAPHAISVSGSMEVAENSENGQTLGLVSALDVDDVDLSYSLASNADGRFAIDADSGELYVLEGSLLDHEQASSHVIEVVAKDPLGASISSAETIAVIDVNESPSIPVVLALDAIDEDVADPPGASIASLVDQVFVDLDAGQSLIGIAVVGNSSSASQGHWQFQIGAGAWQNILPVAPNVALMLKPDANLRFLPDLDFNGQPGPLTIYALDNQYSGALTTHSNSPIYSYDILADAGSSLSESSADITTMVSPVDHPPTVAVTMLNSSVVENADTTMPFDVASLAIFGVDGELHMPTLTGADAAYFQITNDTLQLIPGAVLDAEALPQLDVTVDVAGVASNVTLLITDVNEAPELSQIELDPIVYIENDEPTPISTSLSLSDPENGSIESAQVQLASGFQALEDSLLFVDQSGITGQFDVDSGILSLTGRASLAEYQAALRTVLYHNSSDHPHPDARELQITISDGENVSTSVARTLNVVPVNDEEQLVVNEAVILNQNQSFVLTDSMINSVDMDNTRGQMTFTKAGDWGTVTLTVDGIEASSFTQADVDAGLVVLLTQESSAQTDKLQLSLDDGQGTATNVDIAIDVIPAPIPELIPEPEPGIAAAEPEPIEYVAPEVLTALPAVDMASLVNSIEPVEEVSAVSAEPGSTSQNEQSAEASSNDAEPEQGDDKSSATALGAAFAESLNVPEFVTVHRSMEASEVVEALATPSGVIQRSIKLTDIEKTQNQLTSLLSLEPLRINELAVYTNPNDNVGLLLSIEKMQEQLARSTEKMEGKAVARETVLGFSLSITAGFLIWLLRGGALLASMFSISPLWKQLDPLPIMNASSDGADALDDDDSVEDLFEEKKKRRL